MSEGLHASNGDNFPVLIIGNQVRAPPALLCGSTTSGGAAPNNISCSRTRHERRSMLRDAESLSPSLQSLPCLKLLYSLENVHSNTERLPGRDITTVEGDECVEVFTVSGRRSIYHPLGTSAYLSKSEKTRRLAARTDPRDRARVTLPHGLRRRRLRNTPRAVLVVVPKAGVPDEPACTRRPRSGNAVIAPAITLGDTASACVNAG